MTTVNDIHEEIERVSERRAELRQRLSQQHDPALVAEIKVVDGELERLWDDLRALRARLRFGDRDKIVSRARIEERLERAA